MFRSRLSRWFGRIVRRAFADGRRRTCLCGNGSVLLLMIEKDAEAGRDEEDDNRAHGAENSISRARVLSAIRCRSLMVVLITQVKARQLRWLGMILFACILVPPAPVDAQVYQGRELVKAELVANTATVAPGKAFTAGLLLKIAHGWHTYWKFSGDAGLPIELNWKLPPGWKTGPVRWPIPLKFDDPGDIKTYGYHDEVLLMQEIIPPSSIKEQKVTLTADTNWLVCERICIPGSAALQLELPVGQQSTGANDQLFSRYRNLLPQDQRSGNSVSLGWSRTGADLHLKVRGKDFARHAQVDFYPLPDEKTIVGHPAVESHTADEVNFRIPLESAAEKVTS